MILNEHLAEPYLVAAQPELHMDPSSAYAELAVQLVPTSLPNLPSGMLPSGSSAPAMEVSGSQQSRLRESGRAVLRLFGK